VEEDHRLARTLVGPVLDLAIFATVVVDIGREDLNRATAPGLGQSLLQQDGDRVGFLAGGTAGHPDPSCRIGESTLCVVWRDRHSSNE
jgi:hypothetical protein